MATKQLQTCQPSQKTTILGQSFDGLAVQELELQQPAQGSNALRKRVQSPAPGEGQRRQARLRTQTLWQCLKAGAAFHLQELQSTAASWLSQSGNSSRLVQPLI